MFQTHFSLKVVPVFRQNSAFLPVTDRTHNHLCKASPVETYIMYIINEWVFVVLHITALSYSIIQLKMYCETKQIINLTVCHLVVK